MTISISTPTSNTGSIQNNSTDVLTVDSSNNITVTNNLLVSGTTTSTGAITGTGGIYLGGTASANLLDDYEEGTWTPTLDSATTSPSAVSYVYNEGHYIKIGSLVYTTCILRISSRTGGTGQLIITGLPFTVADVLNGTAVESNASVAYWGSLTVAKSYVSAWAFNNTNSMYFTCTPAGGSTVIDDLDISETSTASFQIRVTLSYVTTE